MIDNLKQLLPRLDRQRNGDRDEFQKVGSQRVRVRAWLKFPKMVSLVRFRTTDAKNSLRSFTMYTRRER
jgi:hypothetical protein